ncbi:MAG: acyltransferase [Deltaproteobacteria bacterium]|nr:acyltransferase [Deltaproteobacteria bacterium]
MTPPGPAPQPHAPRQLSLDVLRTFSILLVLGRHTADIPALPEPAATVLSTLHCGGWIGVDLFFVLSGFLVSGLLFDEHARTGHLRPGRFLLRRAFKIYPAFYAMIALSILAIARRGPLPVKSVLAEVLFFQNYTWGLWPHTWSLAVEEHFYLFLPALLLVLLRLNRGARDPFRLVPAIWLAMAALLLGLRCLNLTRPFGLSTHLMATHLRIDSLMLGVAIAWLFRRRPEVIAALQRHRSRVGLVGAALLAPAFIFELARTPFIWTAGYLEFALGAGLILIALHGALPPNPLTRALAFVGARSYSIYVWHMPLRFWISDKLAARLGLGFLGSSLLFCVSSIALGIGMAALLEQPMLRLRDRLVSV